MFLRKACEDIFLSPSQKQQPVITTEWKKKYLNIQITLKYLTELCLIQGDKGILVTNKIIVMSRPLNQ